MLKLLQRFLGKTEKRGSPISVLQIEVTTRCQLKCTFCPNSVLGDRWERGDFSWELYRDAVSPYFLGVDWVYLQGWGEPLLHPRLWDMFRLAKERARRVGFTTNGMLLDEKNARRFVAEEGDLVDISFSGNTAATHEALRCGSGLAQLKENVRRLANLKMQVNADKPVIVLSYLLTRPSIGELPDFIDTAAEIGANEVVAINLDYTPYQAQDNLRVFSCANGAKPEYEAILQEAARRAKQLGLVFRRYPLSMDESVLVCDARPLDTVFINQRGQVTPCTYLGMAVKGEIPRLFCGQPFPVFPVSYGHLAEGLLTVWDGPAAWVFKEPFARRHALSGPAAAFLRIGDNAEPKVPPPPPPCVHCHKLYKL
ncbi:MAG: radical SAM protein [Anaerolineae bacterium]|nr:radical SAM protein [Anaerolineae bacterium]